MPVVRGVLPLALALTLLAWPARPATGTAKLPAADAFKTSAAAQAHCPGDVVVWSTLSKSKAYHLAASRYYGKTKHGAYVCEKDANAAGFHQAKS
jgi:hypothetical protein